MVRLAFIVLFLVFNRSWAKSFVSADPEYAREFIGAFQAFCPSNGNWTSNALSSATKISSVLKGMRDDPSCVDVAKIVSDHVQTLSNGLKLLEESNDRDLFARQRQQLNIISILESETDADRIRSLREVFDRNQLDIAYGRGRVAHDKKMAKRQYLANSVVNSATQLFARVGANRRCLLSSPHLTSGLSSIGTNLATFLFTGNASIGMGAASHILGNIIEFMRTKKLDRMIQKLGQSGFVTAYQCVLESLSNQYCEAGEALELIHLKMNSRSNQASSFAQGVKILGRELPLLVTWLNSLEAATSPQNSSIAQRQKTFLFREMSLKSWNLQVLGRLGDVEQRLPNEIDTDAKRSLQFNLLKNIIISSLPSDVAALGEEATPVAIHIPFTMRPLLWNFLGFLPEYLLSTFPDPKTLAE